MLEIIILDIIGILLLFYILKKESGKFNIISIILLILEIISLCYMPFSYYNNNDISTLERVFVYIFAIAIPIIISVYIFVSNRSFSESIIIVYTKLLYSRGKTKLAKKILLKYIRKNPKSYILHKTLGEIYEKEGGIRKAISQYLVVIELNRVEYDTMLKIIVLLQVLEQKDEALELLEKLITLQKGYPEAYIMYAELLEEKGLKKDASRVYLEGLKYNPDNFDLNYNLALLYAKLNEYNTSKKYLEKAYEIDPKSYITVLNLAQMELIEKDYDKAKKYLDIAIIDEKIVDIVNYEYAKIEQLKGDSKKALERLNYALEINPDIIEKINENEIFKDIKQDTVVRVQLLKNERPKLEKNYIDMINILEEALEIAISLTKNEKNVIRSSKIDNIIREKSESKSIGELQDNFLNTQEFLDKHVKNADKEFNKHFYGDNGRHSIYNEKDKNNLKNDKNN